MWRLIFPGLAYVILAAHVMFHGLGLIAAVAALIPIALLGIRQKAVCYGHAVLLVLTACEWVRTTWALLEVRWAHGMDWKLAAAILIGCAVLSLVSAWIMVRRAR